MNKIWYHNPNTNESKLLNKDDVIPDGWEPGRSNFDRTASVGTSIYNNGNIEKFFSDLDDIPSDFIKGRLSSTKEKIKNTNIIRYGVENVSQSDDVKNKLKTHWSSLGVSSPMQLQENKDKSVQTCKDRYGVDYYFQSKDYKDKSKKTSLMKYGVDHPSKNSDVKRKVALTKNKKYGIYYFNNPEKVNQTCLSKYGLDYACMLPQCKVKGNNSKPNRVFSEKLNENNIEFSREFPINKNQFDFKVRDILIEIDPSITHNSTFSIYKTKVKDKNYHYNKSMLARENGYRCIHVFDWDDQDKIINLLKFRKTVFARKCTVKEVSIVDSNNYLDMYHLQGHTKSDIRLGLYFNNELVSLMTFGKPRYNKNYQYELIRYCSHFNVVGGAERLFKHFIDMYNPRSIISYCDLSKFDGNVYTKLGFNLKTVSIGKHWFNIKTKQHITDNLLRQRGFDQLFKTNFGKGTSNDELMKHHGFIEIYDCGQATYELMISPAHTRDFSRE